MFAVIFQDWVINIMDADLYDEFGNYIGPELDSDDEDDVDVPHEDQQQADEDDQEEQEVRNWDVL